MSTYDGISLPGYSPGILFGSSDALVAREAGAEATPSGFWDFLNQGVSAASSAAREYFSTVAAQNAAQAAGQPERTTEYQFIPRDFGGSASSGGIALSWPVIALVGIAAFLLIKGNT